jgi:hypothetical protein
MARSGEKGIDSAWTVPARPAPKINAKMNRSSPRLRPDRGRPAAAWRVRGFFTVAFSWELAWAEL